MNSSRNSESLPLEGQTHQRKNCGGVAVHSGEAVPDDADAHDISSARRDGFSVRHSLQQPGVCDSNFENGNGKSVIVWHPSAARRWLRSLRETDQTPVNSLPASDSLEMCETVARFINVLY